MMAEVTKAETCHQKLGDTVCIARVRKRPLEDGKYDNETHVKQDRQPNSADEVGRGSSPLPKHATGSAAVLDEIEQHFQRSLSQAARWKAAEKEDKKVLVPNSSNVPPLIQAFEEDISEGEVSRNTTCQTHVSTSSVIPLYVCSGSDVSARNAVPPISRGHEEMKIKTLQSPLHSPADDAAPLPATSGRLHVYPSIVSSSMSAGVSQSPASSHFPFLPAATEQPSSKLPDHTSIQHNTPTNIQSHISPVPPGNHVQVIDLTKSWAKSLAGSPSCSTVFTTPSAVQLPAALPAAASHPLRVPTVSNLTASNGTTAKSRPDIAVPNNGTSPITLKDVQVASNSGSPIMLLPTSTMMMQPQPYVFLNPTDLQHVNIAPLMNSSSYFPAPTKLVPEVLTAGAGNGYFLVSPNQMLQVVSNAGTGMVPPTVSTPTLLPTSQPVTYMNISTKSVNPFKSASHNLSKERDEDIDVMPATVEDHFAKALGDQWSKLNSNDTVSPSQSTVIS